MSNQILVVDDDVNALDGYLDFLADAGFAVQGAANGQAALHLALDHPPSAIVTDIGLPGLDGFTLAEAIRDDPRTQMVPVLGLTGQWSREISLRASRAGMAAMLMKPCVPSHLIAELKRVLARDTAR
jgi:DNA-binding response OmpR family regulator